MIIGSENCFWISKEHHHHRFEESLMGCRGALVSHCRGINASSFDSVIKDYLISAGLNFYPTLSGYFLAFRATKAKLTAMGD